MVEGGVLHKERRTTGTRKQVVPVYLCTVIIARFKHLPLSAWGELKRVVQALRVFVWCCVAHKEIPSQTRMWTQIHITNHRVFH